MKLRMKSVLTGPKVHRSNRDIFADTPNVIERKTIGPACIAIAMRAGEIAFIGEPKPDRETFAAGFLHHLADITFGNDDPPINAACSGAYRYVAIVMAQDFEVSRTIVCHHRRADLAQSYPMAPSGAV